MVREPRLKEGCVQEAREPLSPWHPTPPDTPPLAKRWFPGSSAPPSTQAGSRGSHTGWSPLRVPAPTPSQPLLIKSLTSE